MKKGNVTLQDIARRAGCSANTVSLSLRDSPRISKAMRARVQKLAEELNYAPNYAAQNLRRRRSGLIGIHLAQALHDAVRTEMVNRLLDELHTAEYRPVLGIGEGTEQDWCASPWIETFRQLQVEALVVIASHVTHLPEWAGDLPVVLLGCEPDDSLPCDYLALDRAAAGRTAVEHLLSRGHRDILVACSPRYSFTDGCIAAIREARAKAHFHQDAGDLRWAEDGLRFARQIADQRAAATATVFGDSGLAAGYVRGLIDAGIRVPDEMAVAAYDYFPWAGMLAVPLTTVEQPIARMAPAAVELVKNRLAHPKAPPVHLVQDHVLMVRQSS
ncbi:MAG: LacI family transcriptional regulator [Phycisphaerae bacterium]|nr:LacI family transcriptional regulator [Phycisphaerae bacterium]